MYTPYIVIVAVLVVVGIGTRVSGGGNPNYKFTWGPETPGRVPDV